MRINALRKELAALLDNSGAQRKPALRRSLREDWLYATDYPALCSGSMPETVMEQLKTAGWETAPDGDWLQLRKPAGEPPEDWYEGSFGPEAACCLSLLERHAGTACRKAGLAAFGDALDAIRARSKEKRHGTFSAMPEVRKI